MRAMILAAGLGTRLRPLTDNKPKALVEIGGRTLLETTIDKLVKSGFNYLVVNVHHHSELVKNYLASLKEERGVIKISDESEKLLDTGGALKLAAKYFEGSEPVLIHNVDIISSINLQELVSYHKNSGALATLAVSNRVSSRYLSFDEENKLCGWRNDKTGEEIIVHKKKQVKQLAFSGVHVISTDLFGCFPGEDKFSIIDLYLELAKKKKIIAFEHNAENFIDVGKPESIKKAELFLMNTEGL